MNESYLDECEAQKCPKDSLPPIEDKHFFNGGRGLENKLICASASKFWYAWHASASKSTMNRGTDASSITEILKPFSNLDIVVPSFSSNANAKGEHQMVCDVLRVGGANVKTISPNGVASLAVYATATQENKMASDMDEDEEDTVDIIVCDKETKPHPDASRKPWTRTQTHLSFPQNILSDFFPPGRRFERVRIV